MRKSSIHQRNGQSNSFVPIHLPCGSLREPLGLAQTDTHVSLVIAYYNDDAKTKTPTALYHLCDAIDVNDSFREI